MLKLPMGCAVEGAGNRAIAAATVRKWRKTRDLANTRSLLRADDDFLLCQPRQCLYGLFGIENAEVSIGCQRLLQVASCLRGIPCFFIDHSGVKEQLCVLCSLRQSV